MRCAVLGSPIAHSLSPVLHRTAYDALGLDWSYEAVEVDEEGLAGFLAGLDESWRGLSLTMPLKRAVLPLLDEVSATARRVGGANTVLFDDGRRLGDNSDVPGAVAALRERHPSSISSVLVIGGGATAASMTLVAAELGATAITYAVRDAGRTEATVRLAEELFGSGRVQVMPSLDGTGGPADHDLLVSTIPARAQDDRVLAMLERARLVFDVGYDPWPTAVAERAAALGRPFVSGLDLLVHQAVLQVELMTGRRPPLDVLRAAAMAVVAGRGG